MAYTPLYQQPGFRQSVPSEGTWQHVPKDGFGGITWRNADTGETVVCPVIWYTLPGKTYATSLRFNAVRAEQSAERREAEGMPWSAGDAEKMRQDARRLRAMAMLCDRSPDYPAGSIDFRGLSDPTTPKDVQDTIVTDIEAGF
ncbi:hypothetical protein [Roseibium sp. Sym1]|uniref:hypothetical protein n=1 Tax=Roseibium sp. Sym1 TaxID=3016006 RepID=UPI0022B4DC09|nr:hypothetical protein [Roseibium sp. Sym1]